MDLFFSFSTCLPLAVQLALMLAQPAPDGMVHQGHSALEDDSVPFAMFLCQPVVPSGTAGIRAERCTMQYSLYCLLGVSEKKMAKHTPGEYKTSAKLRCQPSLSLLERFSIGSSSSISSTEVC
jgi:hypothetical protein